MAISKGRLGDNFETKKKLTLHYLVKNTTNKNSPCLDHQVLKSLKQNP